MPPLDTTIFRTLKERTLGNGGSPVMVNPPLPPNTPMSSPSVPAVSDDADDSSTDADNGDVGGNTDDSSATAE